MKNTAIGHLLGRLPAPLAFAEASSRLLTASYPDAVIVEIYRAAADVARDGSLRRTTCLLVAAMHSGDAIAANLLQAQWNTLSKDPHAIKLSIPREPSSVAEFNRRVLKDLTSASTPSAVAAPAGVMPEVTLEPTPVADLVM